MFVVGPARRTEPPEGVATDGSNWIVQWPVVWEDDNGYQSSAIALRESRESTQQVADALNTVLAGS